MDLKYRLRQTEEESASWNQTAKKYKSYIAILKKTICDLKNPTLIHKYEEQGRIKAE